MASVSACGSCGVDTHRMLPWHNFNLVQIPPGEAGITAHLTYHSVVAIQQILAHISVPLFFLMSGYLYFLKTKGEQFSIEDYKAKTRSRIFTLLIPYIAWNALQIIHILIIAIRDGGSYDKISLETLPHLLWDYSQWDRSYCTIFGEVQHMTGPVFLVGWFIRDLIIVCLAAPAIWWLITKTKGWILLIFGLFYVTWAWPIASGLSITTVFWFSFGALFSIKKLNFVDVFRRFKWLNLVVSIISFVVLLANWRKEQDTWWPTVFYVTYVVSTAMVVVCFTATLLERGKIQQRSGLGDSTYFIYLGHPFLVGYVLKFLSIMPFQGVPAWFLGVAIIVIALLCVYAFLRKYVPWTLRVLLGQK